MQVSDALKQRKSTRAFLKQIVEPEKITRILTAARHAPSGVNTQPWQVAVLSGASKAMLQKKLDHAFRTGAQAHVDYAYYPSDWRSPYKERRKACGLQLYSALAINKEDKARKIEQWAANYRAFDAPVMFLFFMDSALATGSFLDFGMFLQSVMLMAVEEGLATCPQASLAEYPDIVKQTLGYPDNTKLICGMALGYEDSEAAVNSYRTPRMKLEEFTRFFR